MGLGGWDSTIIKAVAGATSERIEGAGRGRGSQKAGLYKISEERV